MTLTTSLFTGRLPRWFWPVLLGLNLALHVPFFRLPPNSAHVWRQCNTMAVARNLYEEGMNPLRPSVDRRLDTNGVTGANFPSYEWLVAGSYRLLGFDESLPRIINWFIYMLGVWAFYALVRRISGADWLGGIAAWCLAWSPEMYFHGINALPDVLALTASLLGLWAFVRWRDTRRPLLLALSMVATALGGLTKLQFLIVGFPMAVLVLRDALERRLSLRDWLLLAGYAAVTVTLPLAWYVYADYLIKTSGLADFGLLIRPETDPAVAFPIIKRNLISDWPEVLLGYGALVLLVVGLVRLVRQAPTRHPWFLPGLAWAGALLAYYLLELHQMQFHLYYQIPLLPVLLLLATWGAAWLARHPKGRPWLLLFLLVQPVWAFVRIGWLRWATGDPDIPTELYAPATRAALTAATPAGALCVVGPDESGCKMFYFLHKKGFGFDTPQQLAGPASDSSTRPYLDACVARGARFLYTNDTTTLSSPTVRPYLGRQVARVGQFQVWALQPAQLD
ncbi:ArnT family glycosyltransferase [Hymenobacter sp. B1770]|uniref:ArnT family glycosyltransferase n=1 Tax=Hymenobacter sp. B1770 TaxID=1718788 RepID=UPI003CF245C1